jgi:hypothetical protein
MGEKIDIPDAPNPIKPDPKTGSRNYPDKMIGKITGKTSGKGSGKK